MQWLQNELRHFLLCISGSFTFAERPSVANVFGGESCLDSIVKGICSGFYLSEVFRLWWLNTHPRNEFLSEFEIGISLEGVLETLDLPMLIHHFARFLPHNRIPLLPILSVDHLYQLLIIGNLTALHNFHLRLILLWTSEFQMTVQTMLRTLRVFHRKVQFLGNAIRIHFINGRVCFPPLIVCTSPSFGQSAQFIYWHVSIRSFVLLPW